MRVRRFAMAAAMAVVASAGAVAVMATPANAGSRTFQTLANLNLRTCQWLNEPVCKPIKAVIPNGTWIELNCWEYGTPVNGDNIWYNTEYKGQTGMVAGYYMATGRDPNPNVYRCG